MGMPTAERGTPMPDLPLLLQIFLSFIKIDILCFGGAYAAVPVVQQQVVEVKDWMTTSEFMDLLAIDELTPGPIVVNCATFVGNKLAGVPGGIVATMGCVLPTALIALALVRLYLRYRDAQVMEDALTGIKSVVAALLLTAALTFVTSVIVVSGQVDLIALAVAAVAFVLMRTRRFDTIAIIIGSGVFTLLLYTFVL